MSDELREAIEQSNAEQATGLDGSGDYRAYARQQGFDHLIVWDWTSSAGDWSFLVSKDRKDWHVMSQENRWPSRGFDRSINETPTFGFEEPQEDDVVIAAFAQIIEDDNG